MHGIHTHVRRLRMNPLLARRPRLIRYGEGGGAEMGWMR